MPGKSERLAPSGNFDRAGAPANHGGVSTESSTQPSGPRGVEHAHVIDIVAHDAKSDEVTLIMLEPRPWDGTELRLFQLQEKINAYLSFALDGEMAEAYPALMDKKLRLRLDCVTYPDDAVVGFLDHVRKQIAFQGIDLEVCVATAGGCGPDCGCH